MHFSAFSSYNIWYLHHESFFPIPPPGVAALPPLPLPALPALPPLPPPLPLPPLAAGRVGERPLVVTVATRPGSSMLEAVGVVLGKATMRSAMAAMASTLGRSAAMIWAPTACGRHRMKISWKSVSSWQLGGLFARISVSAADGCLSPSMGESRTAAASCHFVLP